MTGEKNAADDSELGGFPHADSIEPGVLDEQHEPSDEPDQTADDADDPSE